MFRFCSGISYSSAFSPIIFSLPIILTVSLRKVRSRLGELAHLTEPAHLPMNSPLKGTGTEKRGGEIEILKKKRSKLGQGVGALKEGNGIPLGTMTNLNILVCLCFYMLFMLRASASFKGRDFQNFCEGGRTLYGGT